MTINVFLANFLHETTFIANRTMSKKNKIFNKNRFAANGSKNMKDRDINNTTANTPDEVYIDLDDVSQQPDATSDNLNVEILEDELIEDVVDAEDETVLPEDNAAQAKIEELNAALEKEKKDYLYLMADFDNFRKRVMREKADLIKNAAEKVLKGLLPIVDDFERGLSAAQKSDAENSDALMQGMELIYNKLIKYLADNGVKAMETPVDSDFDADLHEAIASVPTGDESKKGKIIDTTQKGYMLNDKVLRHAKVVVGE